MQLEEEERVERRVCPAQQVRAERQEHLVPLEQQVLQDLAEALEASAHPDRREHLEEVARQERRVRLDLPEQPEALERTDQVARQAPAVVPA